MTQHAKARDAGEADEPVYKLTRDELVRLVTAAAEQGAARALSAKPIVSAPRRMNTAAVAAHYGVATSTVRSWVALDAPHRRFGRDFVFDIEALDAWHAERNAQRIRLVK